MSEVNKNEVHSADGNVAVNESHSTLVATKGFDAVATMNALNEAMSGECQGLEFSFDKVTLPTGGGTMFQMPSSDGSEPEMVKEIRGVIIYNLPAYSYYKEKYTGQNNPPDCYSIDGKHGVGCPGGECLKCPYNVFGSADNNAKACKNKRMLYILMEGEMFPIVLYLPAGSIKAFTQYVKGQLSKGKKVSQLVTNITLKKAQNASGIAYSQAVFKAERVLSDDEKSSLTGLVEFVKHYTESRAATVTADDPVETVMDGFTPVDEK